MMLSSKKKVYSFNPKFFFSKKKRRAFLPIKGKKQRFLTYKNTYNKKRLLSYKKNYKKQSFIKGRLLTIKRQRKTKIKYNRPKRILPKRRNPLRIKSVQPIKRRIKSKLIFALKKKKIKIKNIKKKHKKRKKNLHRSYFHRYIYRRKKKLKKKKLKKRSKRKKKITPYKRLFKRTILFNPSQKLDYEQENAYLLKIRDDLSRKEMHRMLSRIKGLYYSSFKPLSQRFFLFGKIYLKYRRRNTFINVNTLYKVYRSTHERVVYKTSCGLIGFSGPKKATDYAKLGVAKKISAFLAKYEFTTIDIIFPAGIQRFFSRLVRSINKEQIIVRYLVIKKRKTHGFTRRKKKRRGY